MNDTTNTTPATSPVKYYPIDENTARRAQEMMSFRDYVPGSKTAEYRRMVDKAAELAAQQKRRVDPLYHDKIDALLDAYARKLAHNMNESSRIGCMCPSVMIAGPAKFPVKKKERQNAADRANMKEFEEIQDILRKIKAVGTGGISSDDTNALDKLREKVARLENLQEQMKAANAAIRMKDTANGDAKLEALGFSMEQIQELRAPDFCGRVGFSSYTLSNNNANIRRLRARIQELEKRQTEAAPEGWTFDGGEVVVNTELNRLQIVLEGRPDEDMKKDLKGHGFRWAPSQRAWQRQLTDNAIRAAKAITERW